LKELEESEGLSDVQLRLKVEQQLATLKPAESFKSPQEFISYVNETFADILPAPISADTVARSAELLMDYASVERDLANLFKDAQYYLDIIDSEKRITKSYFDEKEYTKALEVGRVKSSIQSGTYQTKDGQDFSIQLNLQVLDSIFEQFEKSKSLDDLKRDLRMVGLAVDDSVTAENALQIKEFLSEQIKTGEHTIVNQNLLDDAFRSANAGLLEQWSALKNKYTNELQTKLDAIKKEGLTQKEILGVIDVAFSQFDSSQKNTADFEQLQKNLGALGIVIGSEYSNPDLLQQKRTEIQSQVRKNELTLDTIIFGGVLGEAFVSVSDALRDEVIRVRAQTTQRVKDATDAVIAEFEREIGTEYEKFLDALVTTYSKAIVAKSREILSEVELSERTTAEIDIGEKNTAEIVSRSISQDLTMRRIEQATRVAKKAAQPEVTRFEKIMTNIAAVLDTTTTNILKFFGKEKQAQLITKKKAANIDFEGIPRTYEPAEVSPAALYPNRSMQVIQDQRSLEDKRDMVTPTVQLTIRDGKVVATEAQTQKEIRRGETPTVSGTVVEYREVNGQRTLVLNVTDINTVGEAVIAAIQADAYAGKAGGIDLDRIELTVAGKQQIVLDLGRQTLSNLLEKGYGSALTDAIKNGGILEVSGDLLVFGKNRSGVVEAHNFGKVTDVNPDILTIFEMKRLEQSGDFQQLIAMSGNPLFRHIFQQEVFVENGVIVIGNTVFNKDAVGKASILINSKLGEHVRVGEHVTIINSSIAVDSNLQSSIASGAQLTDVKVGKQVVIENGAILNNVIAHKVTADQDAILERINSRANMISVGARSMLLDYESEYIDGPLRVLGDHFKQGSREAIEYNNDRFEEIILKQEGKLVSKLKDFSRAFAIKSQDADNKYVKQAYAILSQLAGMLTPDAKQARQLAELQRQRAIQTEKLDAEFGDFRERLTNNQKIPYNLLFGIDSEVVAPSAIANEIDKITRIPDVEDRHTEFSRLVTKHFGNYAANVQQQMVDSLMELQPESKWDRFRTLHKGLMRSPVSPSSMSIRAHQEQTIKDIEQGNPVVVGYLKIQNFKDNFNTFGAIHDQGHFLGDAGIAAVGSVLRETLEKRFAEEGVRVHIGNAGAEFFLTFSGMKSPDKANAILTEIIQSSEFKNAVVDRSLKNLKEITPVSAELEQILSDGLRDNRVHFYGGISNESVPLIQRDQTRQITNATKIVDELYKQAFLAAKHQQLLFDDQFQPIITQVRDLIEQGVDPNSQQIQDLFANINDILKNARIAAKTGITLYKQSNTELNTAARMSALVSEYEVLQKPIDGLYSEETSILNLLEAYRIGLEEGKAEEELQSIIDKMVQTMVIYESENLSNTDGVFTGNRIFKNMINYVVWFRPSEDIAVTFRVGGDEYGKIEWNSETGNLRIYRFDGNNVGATSRQWGMRIGDKLIEDSLRVIEATSDMRDLAKNIDAFFNDMRGRGLVLSRPEVAEIEKTVSADKIQYITQEQYDKWSNEEYVSNTRTAVVVLAQLADGTTRLVKFPTIDVPYVVQQQTMTFSQEMLAGDGQVFTALIDNVATDFRVFQEASTGNIVFVDKDGTRIPQPTQFSVSVDAETGAATFSGALLNIDAATYQRYADNGFVTQKNEQAAVIVQSRPVVSVGYVDIAVKDMLVGSSYGRDISVIQGRADSAAEIAKEHVKHHQILHDGRTDNTDVWFQQSVSDFKGTSKELASFETSELDLWDKEAIQQVLNIYSRNNEVQLPKAFEMADAEAVKLMLPETGKVSLRDKLIVTMDSIIKQLPNIDSLEDLEIADAYAQMQMMNDPDSVVSHTDASKIAYRRSQLVDTEQEKKQLTIKAFSHNQTVLYIDPENKEALAFEKQLMQDLASMGVVIDDMLLRVNTQIETIQSRITQHLVDQKGLKQEDAEKLTGYILNLLNVRVDKEIAALGTDAVERRLSILKEQYSDQYPLLAAVISAGNEFVHVNGEEMRWEEFNVTLNRLGIDPVTFIPALRESLDLSDVSGQWNVSESIWEDNMDSGKLLYGDPLFDAVRPSLSRFSVPVRNRISELMLKSFSRYGSGINIYDDVLRDGGNLLERIEGGEYTGKTLQRKSEELLGMFYLAALLAPTQIDALYGLSKAYRIMAQQNGDKTDINKLEQPELEQVLINTGIVQSNAQAQQMATAIIAQRTTSPILLIEDIKNLTQAQKELLRNARLGGREEIFAYYDQVATDITDVALSVAYEIQAPEIADLTIMKVSTMLSNGTSDFKKIGEMLKSAEEAVIRLADKELSKYLIDNIGKLRVEAVIAENQNKDRAEAETAINAVINTIPKDNMYYSDIQLLKVDLLLKWQDFDAAVSLLDELENKYPDLIVTLQMKSLSIDLLKGEKITFLDEVELSKETQAQTMDVLKLIRASLESGAVASNPAYIESLMATLLSLNTRAATADVSDAVSIEVVKTLAGLSGYIQNTIVADVTNPEQRAVVDQLVSLQNQVLDTLMALQAPYGRSPVTAIKTLVDNLKKPGVFDSLSSIPSVAVLRDSLNLSSVDSSGFIQMELNNKKIDKLQAFFKLVDPDATVFILEGHQIVVGASPLQTRLFSALFEKGYQQYTFDSFVMDMMTEFLELAKDKPIDQLIKDIQAQWGVSNAVAVSIAELQGDEAGLVRAGLDTILSNLFQMDEQRLNSLQSLFDMSLQQTISSAINQHVSQLTASETPAEMIGYFQSLNTRIAQQDLLGAGSYQLINASYSLPSNIDSLNTTADVVQQILIPALQNYSQVELLQLQQIGDSKLPAASFAGQPSQIGGLFSFWQSELQKAGTPITNKDLTNIVELRDVFQYLQKVSQGGFEQDIAVLRPRVEAILNQKVGYPIAKDLVIAIEQNKGDVNIALREWSKQLSAYLPPQMQISLTNQIKQALLPDTAPEQLAQTPVTLAAVTSAYANAVSTLFSTMIDQKEKIASLSSLSLTESTIQSIKTVGIENPYALSQDEIRVLSSVVQQRDTQKSSLVQWLESQYQDLIDVDAVSSVILAAQGYKLQPVPSLQASVLKQVILKENLGVRVGSDGVVYMMPDTDITNPETLENVKKQLAQMGIENPTQLLFSDALREIGIVFDMPSTQDLFPGGMTPVEKISSKDEYLTEVLTGILSSTGFWILKRRNPQAAEMVEEYISAVRERRPVNPDKVNMEGLRFIVNIILNKVAVQELVQNENLRNNREVIRSVRSMILKATETVNIVLNGELYFEHRNQIEARRDTLTGLVANLESLLQQMNNEINEPAGVALETLQATQAYLNGLNEIFDSIIATDARILVEASPVKKSNFDYFQQELSDDEKQLIRMSLKRVSGVLSVEDAELGKKFFEVVKSNVKRNEAFKNFLSELANSTNEENLITAAASLTSKIDYYVKDVLGESKDDMSVIATQYTETYVNSRVKSVLLDKIQDEKQRELVESIFNIVGNGISFDIIGNTVKSYPIVEKIIQQLSVITGENIGKLIVDEKLKAYAGILFDEALEASTEEAVVPQIVARLRSNGITDSKNIREGIISLMAHTYLGVDMNPVYSQAFVDDKGLVLPAFKDELTKFLGSNIMVDKAPLLQEIAEQASVTDKRVVFAQMIQELLGTDMFRVSEIAPEEKRQLWDTLLRDLTPASVSEETKADRYVFAISFDTLAKKDGTISSNESTFMVKETIEFLREMSRSQGKDVRFVILSDSYDTSHIQDQLSGLRLSASYVDIFGNDFADRTNSFVDLIDAVQQTYRIDSDNVKIILNENARNNKEIISAVGSRGIQVMNVQPNVKLEQGEDGAMFGATLVGGLNLFVRGAVSPYEAIPNDLRVVDIRKVQIDHETKIMQLLADYKDSFSMELMKNTDFIARLRDIYGIDLSELELQQLFYKSIVQMVMNNNITVTDTLNIQGLKQQLTQALGTILGDVFLNELISNSVFQEQLQGSMVNLVLQPPKQKISSTYLREYEKMKMAEEFA